VSYLLQCLAVRFHLQLQRHLHGPSVKYGSSDDTVFTSSGDILAYSFFLVFACTDNIAEYEALLLGLNLAGEKKIKILHVFGDSDLIVQKGIEECLVKYWRLEHYLNWVWECIELFDRFSITAIPREENECADSLAVAAA
jgi:ribonuclease HI